jgi:alpha/beta superfamily hydrolase
VKQGVINLSDMDEPWDDLAVRTDPETSTTELAGFLGTDADDRFFGAFTLPNGNARGALLMCSALYVEGGRNYRREVILARELARRGVASLRFHYRGSGYSDGDPAALTFTSLNADAADALAELRLRCPGVPIACLGTRLGALVAATVARSDPAMAVLLWDPVASPAVFFQDAMKARRARGMVADRQHGESATAEPDPYEGGSLDALGYRLPRGLRDSLEGVTLADCMGPAARPIQVVTVVPDYEPAPPAVTAAEVLRTSTGSEVGLRRIEGRLSWWTTRDSWEPDEEHAPTREVIATSADWLERQLAGGPS